MTLFLLTVVVGSLTVVPGRATPLRGGVHLVLSPRLLELGVTTPERGRPTAGRRPGRPHPRRTTP